jgi:hypothetical protein
MRTEEMARRNEECKQVCSRFLRYSVSESEEPGLDANRTQTLSDKTERMYDGYTFGLERCSLLLIRASSWTESVNVRTSTALRFSSFSGFLVSDDFSF